MDGLALWIASDAIEHCSQENETSYGVISRQADATNDASLVHAIAAKVSTIFGNGLKTVFLNVSWGFDSPQSATTTIVGSQARTLEPIISLLLHQHFAGRLNKLHSSALQGTPHAVEETYILSTWNASEDEPVLLSILRDAIASADERSQAALPRPLPPVGAISVDQLLAEARSTFKRISASEAHAAFISSTTTQSPSSSPSTFLVDIRPAAQRVSEGGISGALIIERNILERRLDPQCDARLLYPAGLTDRYDNRIVVFCSEGYASSLAAASLVRLGLLEATDIIGGFKAWKQESLPHSPGAAS
jgi:rhodanese-related sulfurtransferase